MKDQWWIYYSRFYEFITMSIISYLLSARIKNRISSTKQQSLDVGQVIVLYSDCLIQGQDFFINNIYCLVAAILGY